MKRLRMDNGDVSDAPRVCRNCQTPNPSYNGIDGEWYCGPDCAPEGV